MPNTAMRARDIGIANKTLASEALILQGYADCFNVQPKIDIRSLTTLVKYQSQINNFFTKAKSHSNYYLNIIQPEIINNIENISNYYALHSALDSLVSKTADEDFIYNIKLLQSYSRKYKEDVNRLTNALEYYKMNIVNDNLSFSEIIINMNKALFGDNELLNSFSRDLQNIDLQISNCLAGKLGSILLGIGSLILMVGSFLGEFKTKLAKYSYNIFTFVFGLSTVGATITIPLLCQNLERKKDNILSKKALLQFEIKYAAAISSNYKTLENRAIKAIAAADKLGDAWRAVIYDLDVLLNNLRSGLVSSGNARKMFIFGAGTAIKKIIRDTNLIKVKMSGVTVLRAKPGQTVINFLENIVKSTGA